MRPLTGIAAVVAALATAAPAGAAVNGISDDNLPLMTAKGRAALQAAGFSHARMVISMGTPASDPQVRAWMTEAQRYGYTITISARRAADQPIPTVRAYRAWLRSLLRAYPINAVEAANEPELTGIAPARAAALYRAARSLNVRVLAGGFSDRPETRRYAPAYVRHITGRPVYALHAYRSIVNNRLADVRRTISTTHARAVWITETAAFVALGRQTFTPAQQRAQAARVVALSRWPVVQRTYWQGWQRCDGCQPQVTSHVPARPTKLGPVLPYTLPASPIVWDSYLLNATANDTTTRPALGKILVR